MKPIRLFVSISIGLCLVILLLHLAGEQAIAAQSKTVSQQIPVATLHYVAVDGNDSGGCTIPDAPCRTIQYAISMAASGDEIRIAAGVYSDVNHLNTLAQVAMITKTITLRGGYSYENWISPYPDINLTTVSAYGQGRGIYANGPITITLDGLQIINCSAAGLGGGSDGNDAGGGIYLNGVYSILSNNHIFGNIGDHGGGVYQTGGRIQFIDNHIISNTSGEKGAGLLLENTSGLVHENSFISNTVLHGGGAIQSEFSNVSLTGNRIEANDRDGLSVLGGVITSTNDFYGSNTGRGVNIREGFATIISSTFFTNEGGGVILDNAQYGEIRHSKFVSNTADNGAGVYSYYSQAIISGNEFFSNTATGTGGGGIYLLNSPSILENNIFAHNLADIWGGGIVVDHSDAVKLVNNVLYKNQAGSIGGGVLIDVSKPISMFHNTLAWNDPPGIMIASNSVVTLTNTVLVSHTIGIWVNNSGIQNSTAYMDGTLWGEGIWANKTDWRYDNPNYFMTGTVNIWGDPGFVNPVSGDFHISRQSYALNTGLDAGVLTDIDGETRPALGRFDIGADELHIPVELESSVLVKSPFSISGLPITFTLLVTNSGDYDLHAIITDMLPLHVTPTGILTWTPVIMSSGGVWREEIAVIPDVAYAGLINDTLWVDTLEGATGFSTNSILLQHPVTGLLAQSSSPTALHQPTNFSASTSTGSDVDYQWAFGDGAVAQGAISSYTYPASGVYSATISAANMVSSQSARTIVIIQEPVNGLLLTSSSPTVLGETTVFTSSVSDGDFITYTWDFGDGGTQTGESTAEHIYTHTGVYTVTLAADNLVSNQTAQATVEIRQNSFNIYLPSLNY